MARGKYVILYKAGKTNMAKLTVYIDGAARGNPGEAGIGIIIKEGSKTLKEISEYTGQTTNNVAEYRALIRALQEILRLGYPKAHFFCDSELLVHQINGQYKVKKEHLKLLFFEARGLIGKLEDFFITYIPREKNKEADKLANQGIDESKQ